METELAGEFEGHPLMLVRHGISEGCQLPICASLLPRKGIESLP